MLDDKGKISAEKQKLKSEIEELVLKTQEGDSGAFARLYDLFVDRIYRYFAFRMDRDEALDFTENLFLKVWQNIGKYKPTQAGFQAWVFRIAHNLLVDHYRFNRVHQELDDKMRDENESSNPKLIAEKNLDLQRLRIGLDKLKPKYKEVLVLRFVNDLGIDEIARVLGKTEIYVRVLQHRAIKELKEILLNEEMFGNR